ncbi:MAG: ATP-binding cassette domain-containing protein [Verrucomicrobia bacterium]|nr:ATP-binding cassette domain-containing protein [Verrucomicrobiota bacterium]MBI3871332.1 ATP-binding cassette domain-containing protein [Verrucomicrobiota bacterium]
MPLLEVSDITIRRGRTLLLDGVSWKVEAGEHWVVLGANGSGKTSLLSALTGYLTPTSGRMRLLGEEFGNSDWRALRLRVGLVSSSIRQLMPDHEPALITVASGRYAMIDFWGDPRREDRARARRILRQIECAALADRPWIYLSQGERQRVLIGRALMARPRLLILDEPCAGLDPAAREQFLHFLDRLGRRRGGPALILVTHHVEEIMPVFTHALVLRRGKVQTQGPTRAALTSATLSRAFDSNAILRKRQSRYSLSIRSNTHSQRVC